MKLMKNRLAALTLILSFLPVSPCGAASSSDLGSWAKSLRTQTAEYLAFLQKLSALKNPADAKKSVAEADKFAARWPEKRTALEKMSFAAGSKEEKAKGLYLEELGYLTEWSGIIAQQLKPSGHVSDKEIGRVQEAGFLASVVGQEADDALAGVAPGPAATSTRWFADMLNHGARYPAVLEKLQTLPPVKVAGDVDALTNEVDRLTIRGSKIPRIGNWADQSRDGFMQSLAKEHESLVALQKVVNSNGATKADAYVAPIAEYRQAFQKARVNLLTSGAAEASSSSAAEPKKAASPAANAVAAKEKEYKENEAMIARLDKYAKPAPAPGSSGAAAVTPPGERAPQRPEVKTPPKVIGAPAGICRSSLSRYPRVSPVMYARCRDANEHSAQAVNVYTYIYKGGMADPLLVSLLKIKTQEQEDCAIQIAKQFAGSMTAAYLEKSCL